MKLFVTFQKTVQKMNFLQLLVNVANDYILIFSITDNKSCYRDTF